MAIATDKLLFLHIPKTGGMWVSRILNSISQSFELDHQHAHFPQLLQLHDAEWYKQKFIFTIIRHPITWYQSRWAFRVKVGWRPGHPLDFNCASNDFHSFVDAALNYKPDGWVTWLYEQYINNVPDGIDYIARLENGCDDIFKIFDMAGVKYDIDAVLNVPRTNDSDMDGHTSKYWAKYTPDLFDRVMNVENKVISKYYHNYVIDPNAHIGPRPW